MRGDLLMAEAERTELMKRSAPEDAEEEGTDGIPQAETLQSIEERLADVMRNPGLPPLEALTVLGAAVFSGQEETVRSLVVHHSKGVDETNEEGQTAAHAACAAGQVRGLQVLQELGADLSKTDGKGRTLARMAAAFGHSDCLKLFREAGCDLSAPCSNGATPAYIAAH
jgi:ankyrin repeat protein